MARNIVEDYILHDKECITNYLNTINAASLEAGMVNVIVKTFIDIRYYDLFDHINDSVMDTLSYYLKKNTEKYLKDREKPLSDNKVNKNIKLALWLMKYILYFEKATSDKKLKKLLEDLEIGLKNKFNEIDSKIIENLFEEIRENTLAKKKALKKCESKEFFLEKREYNLPRVIDCFLKCDIKIPDLYSKTAIDRVFNTGIIAEEKMYVEYTMVGLEVLNNVLNYDYKTHYLIEFNTDLLTKKKKLKSVFNLIDMDLLRDKVCLKISYTDFLCYKEDIKGYIHEGYKFAIIIDSKYDNEPLDIFSYVVITNEMDSSLFKGDNIIVREEER